MNERSKSGSLPVALVLVSEAEFLREGRGLPQMKGVHFVDFKRLTEDVLAQINPNVVLSQVFGVGPDAIEIAASLEDFGFRGRYCAVGRVASPAIIESEVRSVAPSLQFEIICLDDFLGGIRQLRMH